MYWSSCSIQRYSMHVWILGMGTSQHSWSYFQWQANYVLYLCGGLGRDRVFFFLSGRQCFYQCRIPDSGDLKILLFIFPLEAINLCLIVWGGRLVFLPLLKSSDFVWAMVTSICYFLSSLFRVLPHAGERKH